MLTKPTALNWSESNSASLHQTQGVSNEKFHFVKPTTESMRPGESMTLSWWRHMGSAPQITADVHWTRPNGEPHSAAVTLD